MFNIIKERDTNVWKHDLELIQTEQLDLYTIFERDPEFFGESPFSKKESLWSRNMFTILSYTVEGAIWPEDIYNTGTITPWLLTKYIIPLGREIWSHLCTIEKDNIMDRFKSLVFDLITETHGYINGPDANDNKYNNYLYTTSKVLNIINVAKQVNEAIFTYKSK